jgi:hypothetical protein
MIIHKAVIDLNPGLMSVPGQWLLSRSLPRRDVDPAGGSGADIAKNVAPTQWWAAIPAPLNRHGPIEAARRSWDARPRYARAARLTGENPNHRRIGSMRSGTRGASPLRLVDRMARSARASEAPAARFGLEPALADGRHSATKFASPAAVERDDTGHELPAAQNFLHLCGR